jgi:hypothetical protein
MRLSWKTSGDFKIEKPKGKKDTLRVTIGSKPAEGLTYAPKDRVLGSIVIMNRQTLVASAILAQGGDIKDFVSRLKDSTSAHELSFKAVPGKPNAVDILVKFNAGAAARK